MGKVWLEYNGKPLYYSTKVLEKPEPKPYIRFQFTDTSYVPTVGESGCTARYGTWMAYDAANGIWDWTYEGTSWLSAFHNCLVSSILGSNNTVSIIEGNAYGITSMESMFILCYSLTSVSNLDLSSVTSIKKIFMYDNSITAVELLNTENLTTMEESFTYCDSLASLPLFDTRNVTNMYGAFECCESMEHFPLFDTSSVTNMRGMFAECYSLKDIPLYNTSSVTDAYGMFYRCKKVESGALALYQQMSTQAVPPATHTECFYQCGSETTTGAAELAQIPSDWK